MTLVIDMATLQRTDKHDAEFVRVEAPDALRGANREWGAADDLWSNGDRDAELVNACCEVWKRRHDALEHSCAVLADNLLDAQRERDAARKDVEWMQSTAQMAIATRNDAFAERDTLRERVRALEHEAIERAQPCSNPCRACMGSGCDCGANHVADCPESLRATIAALESRLREVRA